MTNVGLSTTNKLKENKKNKTTYTLNHELVKFYLNYSGGFKPSKPLLGTLMLDAEHVKGDASIPKERYSEFSELKPLDSGRK